MGSSCCSSHSANASHFPGGESIGEIVEGVTSQKVPGLDLKSSLNAPQSMITAAGPGVGEYAPMTDMPAAVKATHQDVSFRVRTMAGAEHAICASVSSTVNDVLPAVISKLGLPSDVTVRLVLDDSQLMATQTLLEAGVGEESVVTAAVINGFSIVMTGYNGPNSPRYGMLTQVNYKLSCSCGYVEHFSQSQGYAWYAPSRKVNECPQCGAGQIPQQ